MSRRETNQDRDTSRPSILKTGLAGLVALGSVAAFGGNLLGNGPAANPRGAQVEQKAPAGATPEEVYVLGGMTVESIAKAEGSGVHESLKAREKALEAQLHADYHGVLEPGETLVVPAGSAIHETGSPLFTQPTLLEDFK